MKTLRLPDLQLIIANGLAAQYPSDQFLPAELEDALLAIINGVGLSALSAAVQIAQDVLSNGSTVEELQPLQSLETSDGFGTEYVTREGLNGLIADMSGLEAEKASRVLRLAEQTVNRLISGEDGSEPSDVDLEGVGILQAGPTENTYKINLAKTLVVPPLRHVSALSAIMNVRQAGARSSAAH